MFVVDSQGVHLRGFPLNFGMVAGFAGIGAAERNFICKKVWEQPTWRLFCKCHVDVRLGLKVNQRTCGHKSNCRNVKPPYRRICSNSLVLIFPLIDCLDTM